ncbi:hypothetical protein [Sphingobium cyanobacteriorum]|uniref:hypothetical protein n=1 Tax=Sphingobium cyanobacteriorum TaxID=3063954 RepID=UPI0027147C82|nr:hypothetical protein [Sphingobium sp. HBC34]
MRLNQFSRTLGNEKNVVAWWQRKPIDIRQRAHPFLKFGESTPDEAFWKNRSSEQSGVII